MRDKNHSGWGMLKTNNLPLLPDTLEFGGIIDGARQAKEFSHVGFGNTPP
jgi:hypothetical protein